MKGVVGGPSNGGMSEAGDERLREVHEMKVLANIVSLLVLKGQDLVSGSMKYIRVSYGQHKTISHDLHSLGPI